jgi:lipid II:glycine glycyltransferase (peptidoglycan interpeptide bridge formation enzyme)
MMVSVTQTCENATAAPSGMMVVEQRAEIAVSQEAADPEWDAFLARTPGGHHVQTSLWSRLKAALGWSVVRLVAKESGEIVGGAQILMRRYGMRLRIGYIPKGPVFSAHAARTASAFVAALDEVVREQKLNCIIAQPPEHAAISLPVRDSRYRPVRLVTFLQATTVLDLRPSLDDILMSMRPKTRKSVRQSQQRGVRVRLGSERDLDTFYDLFMATANRRGFRDYSKSYFQQMWKLFEPNGHIQLFIAEVDGKAVSAALRSAFGDTVVCKKRGWCGEFGNLRPNEAVEWAAIQWAKAAGYRYYDFEGIPRSHAETLLRGDSLPQDGVQSPANYKLGFGGEVRILPGPVACFSNPLIRWTHRVLYPKVADWPSIDRLANRIKVS